MSLITSQKTINTIETILRSSKSYKEFLHLINWDSINCNDRLWYYNEGIKCFGKKFVDIAYLHEFDNTALDAVTLIRIKEKVTFDKLYDGFKQISEMEILLKVLLKTDLFWKRKLQYISYHVKRSDCSKELITKGALKALLDLSGGYQLLGTTFHYHERIRSQLKMLFNEDEAVGFMELIKRNLDETKH